MKTPAHILQKIEENRARRDPVLDFSGRRYAGKLGVVPPEIFTLSHLQELRLKHNAIRELPPRLAEMPNLKLIDVRINPLHETNGVGNLFLDYGTFKFLKPALEQVAGLWLRWESDECAEELRQFPNLCCLDLSEQRLREIPASVFELTWLTHLDVSRNQLQRIPEGIARLSGLTTLDLSYNDLQGLPGFTNLAGLSSLTTLNLAGNGLARLPKEAGKLAPFVTLEVETEQAHSIPSDSTGPAQREQLHTATMLNLAGHQLTHLPEWIGELRYLAYLDISHNQIHRLPEWIAQLENLRELTVKYQWKEDTNVLENPSLAVLDIDENGRVNITAMRRWFQDAAAQGVEKIHEAKLLIIGEGGAGKTTLARKLMDPDAALPTQDESTAGIDVWEWHLPETDGDFRLNLWDFGGQEIFHATHQFFFSDSAVYALVADTRRGDTDFYWWLNVVEKFGKGSPVFILKNERDGRPFQLPDETGLRGRFVNLKEIFAADLAEPLPSTGSGSTATPFPEPVEGGTDWRDKLLSFIRYQAAALPHLARAYPKTWLAVRRALEADRRPYISRDEYLRICDAQRLPKASAEPLLTLLHQLGVCLYFAEIPLLRKTVILKPTWATEAVYRVLDDKEVQHDLGRFDRADAARIWSTSKTQRASAYLQGRPVRYEWTPRSYADMHDELLALMEKFELCYELPEGGGYIAPQLLSRERPVYEFSIADTPPPLEKGGRGGFEGTGISTIKYAYTGFMPKGAVGRLAVKLHAWIEDRRRRIWRHGVVLSNSGARAEVTEDLERRELTIRIAGDNRRDLSSVILHELERIHRGFYNLDVKVWVPCQCERAQQAFFALQVLRKFARDRQSIQCQECYQSLEAQDLLDGVLTRAVQEKIQAPDEPRVQVNVNVSQSQQQETVMPSTSEKSVESKNNPWISGSFYTVNYAVVIAGFIAASYVNAWALPLIAVGTLLTVGVVGAQQLRNDAQLSQKNFMELMLESYKRLLLLRRSDGMPPQEEGKKAEESQKRNE